MAYATISDLQGRMANTMAETQQTIATNLLDDAAIIIDAYNDEATASAKKIVSIRMVIRAIGDTDGVNVPIGATQGSMSALGYSQSWTMTNGSVGELYLSRMDKKLLGAGNSIGASNPFADLIEGEGDSDD